MNHPLVKFLIAIPLLLISSGCSTSQIFSSVVSMTANEVGTVVFLNELSKETELFRDHWEILNDGRFESRGEITETERKRLEKDLNKIAAKLSEEIIRQEQTTPALRALRFHTGSASFPGVQVRLVQDSSPIARTKQDIKLPVIEISTGLLRTNLNNASNYMWEQKRRVRAELSKTLEGDDLDAAVTERASIPGALEYKESLFFLIGHELVHAWLDAPEVGDYDVAEERERETRADALGLLIVSNISYIVKVKQRLEGAENLVLVVNSNSPRSAQAAVLYARSGPEYLFDANQSIYGNASPIYRSREVRQADAKKFMNRAVYNNLTVPPDSYFYYLLKKL